MIRSISPMTAGCHVNSAVWPNGLRSAYLMTIIIMEASGLPSAEERHVSANGDTKEGINGVYQRSAFKMWICALSMGMCGDKRHMPVRGEGGELCTVELMKAVAVGHLHLFLCFTTLLLSRP